MKKQERWLIKIVHRDSEEVALTIGPMDKATMQRSRDLEQLMGSHPESKYKTRSVRLHDDHDHLS